MQRIDKMENFFIFRDYDKALEIYKKILEDNPDDDFVYGIFNRPGGGFLIEIMEIDTGKRVGFL